MYEGRLVGVRPLESADLPVLTRLANSPETRQMVVGWDWPIAAAGQEAWLESTRTSGGTHRMAVVDLASGRTIGMTGFWDVDWRNRSALSAIKLDGELAPKGAGSDTIMLINALAFYEVGLRRLWGAILDFNGPSYGAYVGNCGWRVEGIEKEAVFRNGGWVDSLRVAILRKDFEQLPAAVWYRQRVAPVPQARIDGLPAGS